jgi:hypothetical protein
MDIKKTKGAYPKMAKQTSQIPKNSRLTTTGGVGKSGTGKMMTKKGMC